MFGTPGSSDFDLRFQILSVPVRVTPWFWLFAFLLHLDSPSISDILIWVVCVFVSILIHEFGHAMMAKAFGCWPTVVLHGGYGLCDSQAERQSFWQRLAVLAAGPGAGLLTYGLISGAVYGLRPNLSPIGEAFVFYLIIINKVWSIINLFPIIPLDGGQMMGLVLGRLSPRHGIRWAHVISLVGAGGLACLAFFFNEIWMTLVFGLMAVTNYQALQALYTYARSGDDSDGWRR